MFRFIILFLFSCSPLFADQLIIEPDMGRAPIINAMNDANYSLDLVMYGFTDETLLNSLIKQKNDGKAIKVILEKTPYKSESENIKTIAAFTNHDIAWQGNIAPFRLIHQKTLLIDDQKAIVMTFNFTKSSFKNERNFGLVIDDKKRVKNIATQFSADWNHKGFVNSDDDLIYSPDDSREKIISLIDHAKTSLQIYAQTVSDFKIIGALAKAGNRGVKVAIITSSKLRDKQNDYLTKANVHIYQSKHYYIHAKVFIIDEELALIGSINLTRASLDDNRELAVITRDKKVIEKLTETFDYDWQGENFTGIKSTPYKINQRDIVSIIKLIKRSASTLLHESSSHPKTKRTRKNNYQHAAES